MCLPNLSDPACLNKRHFCRIYIYNSYLFEK
jgi:hypothetical protein